MAEFRIAAGVGTGRSQIRGQYVKRKRSAYRTAYLAWRSIQAETGLRREDVEIAHTRWDWQWRIIGGTVWPG